MYHLNIRLGREKRRLRIRKKIQGTLIKPRLSVYRSNKYIYAQLIDDAAGKTLVDVMGDAAKLDAKLTKKQQAFELGKLLATKAKEKEILTAVFDRGGYRYHGRVRSLCDGAREGGLSL